MESRKSDPNYVKNKYKISNFSQRVKCFIPNVPEQPVNFIDSETHGSLSSWEISKMSQGPATGILLQSLLQASDSACVLFLLVYNVNPH